MIFKSISINLDESPIGVDLCIEDGLPQININMNGVSVTIGTHDKFTFSDVRNLANAMIEFADYNDGKEDIKTDNMVLCSLTSQMSENNTYVKTIEPLTTCDNLYDARRFKISDIETIKEKLKQYDPKFYINVKLFYRQLGNCKEYFDIIDGSVIYTTIDRRKLKEYGIYESVKKAIIDHDEKHWIVRSCPISKLIEII